VSENIRVRSILGRYLEHSRVFSFANAGDPQVFIGSADMMHRNLDRRVEALVRLTEPDHLRDIDRVFETEMSDHTASWWLDATGLWTHHSVDENGKPLDDAQDVTMREIAARKRTSGVLR
jgi:polyphosphate kinase